MLVRHLKTQKIHILQPNADKTCCGIIINDKFESTENHPSSQLLVC